MQNVAHQIPGNAEVIDGLKKALVRAENGMARAVAIVFCEQAGADVIYLGDVHARAQVVYGCTLLNNLLVTSTSMNVRPLEERRLANAVKYDLTADPICFDFMPWLVAAEMKRRLENAPSPLKVAFVRHPGSLQSVTDQKWKFFQNVMRPMLDLFGAVESEEAANGRHEEFNGLRDISATYMQGIDVPRIRVPEAAMAAIGNKINGYQPVTLTLREGPSYEHRNSNIEEWNKLANWLREQGEHVIVVRDTAKADVPFGTFEICPEASKDLHMRAALYEQAKCNLFVTNGPWGLACFGTRPWLMFATIDDNQPEHFNKPNWWEMFMGLNSDKQIPWAGPQQRIVYAPDDFENMRAAYESLQLAK